ncbi:MAG: CARDB domain-containing protein [Candidatus Bathyarchaeales archaeon]
MLTITIILLSLPLPNMKTAISESPSGKIDLFTQKEPYSGKGPNNPSDSFSPQEIVILYAFVTYNEMPVQNLLVAFYVQTPNGTSFSFSEKTNSSGIATINFTIPWPCTNGENEVFGEWHVLADTVIGDELFQDSLTFKVSWLVELISVRTIDENLTYRTNFGINGDVGLEITLKSIAMVTKTATIAIVIQDELDVPISFCEIYDFKVQPNEKLVFLYCKLYIPKWAHVGKATVYVSALTTTPNASGVPYCPSVSTSFYILPYEPLTISFHDVAVVEVVPSADSVEVGQIVNVCAVVQNEGTETESFNVSAYYDGSLIETFSLTLASHSNKVLNFTFNTTGVAPANYTISVSIPYLAHEADLTDNIFVDGIVEVKPKKPAVIHNIAIVDVKPSANIVYIGDSLQINVSILNKGTETENFSIGVYYDFILIETLQVSAFAPGDRQTLTFMWNTSSVSEGVYRISAFAPLPDDIDVSDNTFLDGVVQVKAKPHLLLFHDIAVLTVSPSLTSLYAGEIDEIYVIVKNQGNFTESFNVTIFYDGNIIDTLLVEELESNAQVMLHFSWNTQNVAEGNYTLSALANTVPEEENLENNLYIDGFVEVKAKGVTGWFVPGWFWWLLLLLILIILLLLIWLYLRRRRKKAEEAFRSGWTAWYYCYDLRKIRKV